MELICIYLFLLVLALVAVIISIIISKLSSSFHKKKSDQPSLIVKIIASTLIFIFCLGILVSTIFLIISETNENVENTRELVFVFVIFSVLFLPFLIIYYRSKYSIPKYRQSVPSFDAERKQVNKKISEQFQPYHFPKEDSKSNSK